MKLFKVAILIYCSISMAYASRLRTIEWKEISSKDEIVVYRPEKFKHDSGVIPIKFKARINHNILRVISVLADNKRKTEWMPHAKIVKEIEKKSVSDLTVYYQYDFPWPFSDRDYVIHTLGSYDPKTYTISVNLKSIQHQNAITKKGVIRATSHDGYSIIKSVSENVTEVEMAFLNDLGGWFPTFIFNAIQKKWPYQFMKNLRKQLSRTDIVINQDFKNNKNFLK
ncbi:MAG: hypothetical protein KC493_12115 [Bacteriovoracaceae bacterium]|nr:hypothetical protein [Bacteriovoracaceae bacterium]